MIRIAICDDEDMGALMLKGSCEEWLRTRHMACEIDCYLSGDELLESKKKYHAYFLDMELPGMSGLALSSKLAELYEEYILFFVTGHDEFMEYSFGKNVYGYLTKPYSKWKLTRLLEKMQRYYLDHFKNQTVALAEGEWVKMQKLLYIQAEDNYTKVLLSEGGSVTVRKTLREWEEILPSELFCRIHRSILVNMEHVQKVQDKMVILENGVKLKIGRVYKQKFCDTYMEYRKGRARY